MALRAATLILLSILHVCFPVDPDPAGQPVGWFKKCRSSVDDSMTALEVLPGSGWDNLRNLHMGRVMNFSYEKCQTTEDGVYFIPNDVFVIPWKVTNIEMYAEVFSSWQEHKSSTSFSINADASGILDDMFGLQGKLSAEHQRVKTNQVNDNSATTRVQVRNHIYTVKANPDFRLDPLFIQQIENIAGAIKDNQTELATNRSDKLVADYGTHVITSVDAGAALVKEDYVKSSYVSSSDSSMTSIKASAGFNFIYLFKFDVDISYNHDASEQSKYNSSITSSFMDSYGGLPYYPGMSLKEWQESTRNNLVAIDRSGQPLHYFINTNTLPHLTETTITQVAVSVQQAIVRYYKMNTHPGCVDYNSPNFNFTANVGDGSCAGTSLGGLFHTCNGNYPCTNMPNPDTAAYNCRSPQQQILLHASELDQKGAFSSIYWCYSSDPVKNSGYLFGGFSGNDIENIITKQEKCPSFFQGYIFQDVIATKSVILICLSTNYELAAGRALPFGGFFSCYSANPMTGHRDCPPLFSQILLTVIEDCHIYYCIKIRSV